MAEEAVTPAGEAPAPQTEAAPTTNTNVPVEAPAEAPKAPNLHGFTEDQLADMAKFYASVGGYEKVKSRLSNPQNYQEPVQQSQQQPQQEPAQPTQPQPVRPKEGYATLSELSMERYFKDLAADPKYANISEQIASGEILKEMGAMGMNPIDENYNINIDQLGKFLALKSASVPAKQTSVEPTNIPTVEYVPVENDTIVSTNQALQILQQSMVLEKQGQQPHPAKAKAQEFIKKNGL